MRHDDRRIRDFCDGACFNCHPLFSQDPNALQIVAHCCPKLIGIMKVVLPTDAINFIVYIGKFF